MAQAAERVLLVEDDPDIPEALSFILATEGFNVVSTDNGVMRLTSPRTSFGTIVTDLGLPDMPGDIVIQQILRNDGGDQPRIVVYTGYEESHATKAMAALADVVLTKTAPFELVLNGHTRR